MRVISAVDFLSPAEVAVLAAKTGISQSSTFSKRQVQILGFLQALGSRIGFPQKTIATAQQLVLRFYLFYNPSEFVPHEVALACTSVASKMNDTPKKPREIILSSWALRYPDLVRSAAPLLPSSGKTASSGSTGASPATVSQPVLGAVSENDVDPAVLEKERKRVIAIESLLLKGIAFSFNTSVSECFRLIVKIGRRWQVSKELGKLAWQVCADCHRTYSPLSYPASTVALASIYTAALLCQLRDSERSDRYAYTDVLKRFDDLQFSKSDYLTTMDCIEEVVHSLLDAYTSAAASFYAYSVSASATPISPATPASPAEPLNIESFGENRSTNSTRKIPAHAYSPPPFGVLVCIVDVDGVTDLPAELTRIKITLRRKEDERRIANTAPASVDLSTSAQIVRPFEIGGIQGDMNDQQQDSEGLLAAWQKRAEDKQYASLQRYLF